MATVATVAIAETAEIVATTVVTDTEIEDARDLPTIDTAATETSTPIRPVATTETGKGKTDTLGEIVGATGNGTGTVGEMLVATTMTAAADETETAMMIDAEVETAETMVSPDRNPGAARRRLRSESPPQILQTLFLCWSASVA